MLALARVKVLRPGSTEWSEVLTRVRHDVYHTPEYHSIGGFGQEGEQQAFAYEEGDLTFLWPYLLTPIAGTPGYHDATSVYGYSGPVGSAGKEFLARAWAALQEHWRSQQVVSVFTRFNPLLGNFSCLEGTPAEAGIRECGSTVSIDLTLPAEVQKNQCHRSLRARIRKGREAGLVTVEDVAWTHLDDFVRVYQYTMARLGSRPEYVVDHDWVNRFRRTLGRSARLFVTKHEDSVASVILVMDYGQVLHSHLTATAPEHAVISPSKVMLDDVRAWGAERGYRSMHLGGGLGGREDSLFQFKRQYSPMTHSFRIGSWILNEPIYRELEAQNYARLAAAGIQPDQITYFPSYRFNPAVA